MSPRHASFPSIQHAESNVCNAFSHLKNKSPLNKMLDQLFQKDKSCIRMPKWPLDRSVSGTEAGEHPAFTTEDDFMICMDAVLKKLQVCIFDNVHTHTCHNINSPAYMMFCL